MSSPFLGARLGPSEQQYNNNFRHQARIREIEKEIAGLQEEKKSLKRASRLCGNQRRGECPGMYECALYKEHPELCTF